MSGISVSSSSSMMPVRLPSASPKQAGLDPLARRQGVELERMFCIHVCAAGVSTHWSFPTAAQAHRLCEDVLHRDRREVRRVQVLAVVLEGESVEMGAEAAVGPDLARRLMAVITTSPGVANSSDTRRGRDGERLRPGDWREVAALGGVAARGAVVGPVGVPAAEQGTGQQERKDEAGHWGRP